MTESESSQKTTAGASGDESPATKPREMEIPELIEKLYAGYGPQATDEQKASANGAVKQYLRQVVSKSACRDRYNVLILYDPTSLVKSDADRIYAAVTAFKDKKPLLMVLYSNGGVAGSSYLIGKLCREHSNDTFVISVPRVAKSEATLLCCAADEIHMGSLSELGPIDPQINKMPALGLKNSIEHIAKLVKETPESAEMFAKYLRYSLRLIDLGYYERVAESAVQYAEKLLETHAASLPNQATFIANELVHTYKDHGFILDKTEAARIFGDKIVKTDTDEYSLGNDVYQAMSLISNFADYLGHGFYFIGSLDSDPKFWKKKDR